MRLRTLIDSRRNTSKNPFDEADTGEQSVQCVRLIHKQRFLDPESYTVTT